VRDFVDVRLGRPRDPTVPDAVQYIQRLRALI